MVVAQQIMCCVQVEGKLLCWLCTMTYKRVLAKHTSKNKDYAKRMLGRGDRNSRGPSPAVIGGDDSEQPYSPSNAFASADNSQDEGTPYSPSEGLVINAKDSPGKNNFPCTYM